MFNVINKTHDAIKRVIAIYPLTIIIELLLYAIN